MPTFAIIDDDSASRDVLHSLLLSQYPGAQFFSAESVQSGLQLLKNVVPDVAILDVELPDGLVFDLLKQLPTIPFKLIFVSGFNKYALDAIKFSAFDYLLKPVVPAEFSVTVSKALMANANQSEESFRLMVNNFSADKHEKKLMLRTADSVFVPTLSSIVRCEADWSYTTFFLRDKKKIMITKAIKEYEELLSGYGFIRVHQSHLVNIDCVDHFDKRDGGTLVMVDGSCVPVASRKRQQVLTELANISL